MINISVIIPTWNRAETVERAIRSTLNQTVSPYEVLVCDDGSIDRTLEIVKSINDPRVRWIPGRHSGRPAIPRNRGIGESKGNWLAFLDSDDEWLPEKLEKQLSIVAKTGCKAVCTNAWKFCPGQEIKELYFSNLLQPHDFRFQELVRANYIICSSVLVEKSLILNSVGFPEEEDLKVGEDYALWLRVATQTNFIYSEEALLLYQNDFIHSARSESKDIWTQKRNVLKSFLIWAESLENDIYNKRMIQLALYNYYFIMFRSLLKRYKLG